eukprot:c14753_g1_i2.p1 GENE.c14753_g1_i2~~c14753_g1_i2.p1  ORF type:complete len:348 (+),score=82.89 c14753_g1_i2:77-1120(+)
MEADAAAGQSTPELAKELAERKANEVKLGEAAAERARKFKWNADNICVVAKETTRLNTGSSAVKSSTPAPSGTAAAPSASGGSSGSSKAPAPAASASGGSAPMDIVASAPAAPSVPGEEPWIAPLEALVEVPMKQIEKIERIIKQHSAVLCTNEVADKLGILAIRALKAGKEGISKRYLHHSYIVKYCIALGASGGRMFFEMFHKGKKDSIASFEEDWRKNYELLHDAVVSQMEQDRAEGQPPESVDYSVRGLTERSFSKIKSTIDGLPENLRQAVLDEDSETLMRGLQALPEDEASRYYQMLIDSGHLEVEPVDPVTAAAAAAASKTGGGAAATAGDGAVSDDDDE